MARTVFARGSAFRKPAFQLLTVIKDTGGRLEISKRPAHPDALPHLKSFAEKRDLLLNAGISCDIAQVTSTGKNEERFDFIAGNSLESQLHDAFREDNEKRVEKIFESAFNVIDSLPIKKINPAKNKDYAEVFGEYYNSEFECVQPACIDCNLDNFIEQNGKLTLIDYEWVYTFPVPKIFIKLRVLHHAYLEARTFYLKSKPDRKVVLFADNFFLPLHIHEKYRPLIPDVAAYLQTNLHFLNYLQLPQSKFDSMPAQQTLTAAEALEKTTPYTANGPKFVQTIQNQEGLIAKQRQALEAQEKIIKAKQARIHELESTTTYKVLQRAELRARQKLGQKTRPDS